MLGGQQALDAWVVENGSEEFCRDLAIQQPLAVFRKARGVPGRLVRGQTDEPSEQEIEFEPFH